jgi:hypothetical protein
MAAISQEITRFTKWSAGDKAALDELIPLIYPGIVSSRSCLHAGRVPSTHFKVPRINEFLRLVNQQILNGKPRTLLCRRRSGDATHSG